MARRLDAGYQDELELGVDSPRDLDISAMLDAGAELDASPAHQDPPLWPEITSRCAADAGPLPARAGSSPASAPPKPLAARLAWHTTQPCPSGSGLNGPDVEQTFGTMALGFRGGVRALAVALEQPSAPAYPGFGVKAVAWLDPATGASLGCDLVPDGRGVAASPMIVSRRTGQPLLATVTYQDDTTSWFTAKHPPVVGWWSEGWAEPSDALPIPQAFNTPTPQTKLLPDGQLLIYPRPDRLVSVDARTGALNWVVRPSDIRAALAQPYDGALKMGSVTTRFDPSTRQLRARVLAADGRTITRSLDVLIDACGGVSAPPDANEALSQSVLLGSSALKVSDLGARNISATLELPTGPVHLSGCDELVSLDATAVACLQRGRPAASLNVRVLSEDGSTRSWRLDAAGEADLIQFAASGVALADGVLVLQAELSDLEDGLKIRRRLIFLDWRSGEVLETLDVALPSNVQVSTPQAPPIVHEAGHIMFEFHGHVIGVSTNTSGLSSSLFPRGWRLGRNDNAGVQ